MAGGGSHIFFQTTETRARDGPQSVLGNYRGYLQADANSVYDAFFKDGSVSGFNPSSLSRFAGPKQEPQDPMSADHTF